MSTLAARQPSYSAPQTSPVHQSRSASVTREDDVEPSEEWKQKLRQRIEEGLQDMVHDAKSNLEAKTRQVQGPASTSYREHLNAEYVAALSEIRKLAAEQFQAELERERQERRWAVGIALTPGWDEALKQEQQSILDTIQKAGKSDDFIDLSPQSTRPPYSATRAPPTDPISRRDGSMHPPYPASPSIPDSVSRRDGQTYARTADAYRSPAPPDSASRREGFGSGVSRSQDYAGLSRDRDTLSIRSGDSGYATGTTFVDEPEETLPLRPKRRSDASSHIERPSEDPERPPEPSGRPFDRSSARSVSERHATSPPRIPELWKPSISPEEDIASSRPYQMARRGSTASMKSNNSGSASYRSPSTSAIPERIREHVEAEGSGERERDRDRDRDRERSRTQEIQMSPSPWAYDKPRERHDSTSFRTDNRQGSLNTQQRRPQTVEELEYQSMQHTSYTSWFSDPNAKVIPPPSARLDSADYSPRVTDLRYQTHRSIPRPHIPDEFDFRLPPELPETRPQRTPSLSLDNPSYFGDHETDARLITAATGRRPSLSRRTDDKLPPQSALSAKVAREQSLTMDLAKQQQPLSSPSIGGPKFSPIADEPRYSASNGTRELLDDTSSLRRSEGLNGHVTRSSSVSYGTQGSSRVASTSPNVYSYSAASPTPPMPMPGRSAKYDYQRSSPGSKEWNDSPRSVDTGSFTQYSAAIETRRPLSSRPSLQTFRPELPVVAPEEDLGDDMDLEPIPESTYQRSRHRSSDADVRPYRSQAGADRYRENKRMEEQVRKEEEEKRQRIETARLDEERKKAADEARRNEEMRERFRKREELAAKRREEEAKRRREEDARRQMEEARAEARRREEEEEAERKRVMEEEEARRKQEEEETRRREEEEEARRREEEEARRREEEEEARRREEEEEARRRQEEEEARLKEEEELRLREEAEKAEARRPTSC
ncbi:hypothetical protein ONZ45_g17165 [Pleurotus djamor]|nr:hypothetical protein ONZ45_g17165 [Pleurotus djamor]